MYKAAEKRQCCWRKDNIVGEGFRKSLAKIREKSEEADTLDPCLPCGSQGPAVPGATPPPLPVFPSS